MACIVDGHDYYTYSLNGHKTFLPQKKKNFKNETKNVRGFYKYCQNQKHFFPANKQYLAWATVSFGLIFFGVNIHSSKLRKTCCCGKKGRAECRRANMQNVEISDTE